MIWGQGILWISSEEKNREEKKKNNREIGEGAQ